MGKHSENIGKWLQIIRAEGVGAIAEIEDLILRPRSGQGLKIENLRSKN